MRGLFILLPLWIFFFGNANARPWLCPESNDILTDTLGKAKDTRFESDRNLFKQLIDKRNKLTGFRLGKKPSDTSGHSLSKVFRIHGSASITAYNSNYTFFSQQLPQNYIRYQFAPQVDIFNIPFSTNFFINTANASYKELSTVNLNFNRPLFEQRIREQVRKQADLKKALDAKNNRYYSLLESEYDSLQSQLGQSAYLSEIERYKSILHSESLQDSFSISQNQVQLINAKEKVQLYEEQVKRVQEIEPVVIAYKEEAVKQNLRDQVNANALPDEKKLAELTGMPAKYQNILRLIYSIKSFQLGLAIPRYSELSINGLSIKGADIAINPGNIIFGASYGKPIVPSYNYRDILPEVQLNETNRTLSAGRIGFGKLNNSFLTANYVFIKDNQAGHHISSMAMQNRVLSLQGVLVLHKSLRIEAEAAASATNPVNNENSSGQSLPQNNSAASNACMVKANGILPVTNTNLNASWRHIGPAYQSYGTPFLRNDINRLELKADQNIFRRVLNISAFLRKDHDNLLETKRFRTEVVNYGLGMRLRLKNLPVISASYSPLMQFSETPTRMDSLLFGSDFWSVSMNHVLRKGKFSSSNSATLNTSKSRNSDNTYSNYIYILNSVISVERRFNFSNTFCYSDASGLYSRAKRILYESSMEKILSRRLSIALGGYHKDQDTASALRGGFSTIRLGLTQYCDLQVRGDVFYDSKEAHNTYYSTYCNLILRW